jgi:monothiol glutaredoxin
MALTPELKQRFENEIQSHPVVLYMKGTKDFPMCGFSARAAQILQHLNVDFHDVNILEDDEVRQGLKEFSNWPTFPQLYVKGELVGGCDIMMEMFESGELQKLLEEAGVKR